MLYQNKKADSFKSAYPFVRAERLELSHRKALDPKFDLNRNQRRSKEYKILIY